MTRQRLGLWLSISSIQLLMFGYLIHSGIPELASPLFLLLGGILFIYPDPEKDRGGAAT